MNEFGKRPKDKLPQGDAERTDNRRALGKLGEDAAAVYLEGEGYAILHRNWRCRSGELDIVATGSGTLVVVEVRARTSGGRFGTAAESVDFRKQRQVRALAEMYMQSNRIRAIPVRFDVMALTIEKRTGEITELRHIEGAF